MIKKDILTKVSANHDAVAQHGEGLCLPNLLRLYYEFILKKRFMTTEQIAYRLGTTTYDGTHDGNFHKFLKESSIPTYEEVECSPQRLVTILKKAPSDAMIIANVFDLHDPRPGYDVTNDGPEGHDLWFMNQMSYGGSYFVQVFDPDTYWGGVKLVEINNLFSFWHDGPGSKSGAIPRDGTFTGQENVRWFIILGMNKDQAYKHFGPPEYETKYIERNGLVVPQSGRLEITNGCGSRQLSRLTNPRGHTVQNL